MSTDVDHAGRIGRKNLVITTTVLWAVALILAIFRLYLRLRVQKKVFADDGFLLFGLCCLSAAMGILYTILDQMYLTQSLIMGGFTRVNISPGFIQQAFEYHKMVWVVLFLAWGAIMSVKFSYLCLFRTLILRIRPMMIYWWCLTIFNVALFAYGFVAFVVPCPKLNSVSSLKCTNGSGATYWVKFGDSAMALDILADLLILYIPVHLIWRIKVRRTQKLLLAISLCLTAFVIAVTLVRVSGIRVGSFIDSVWEVYWCIVGAEVGLIMTAATAFRSIFVARASERAQREDKKEWEWYYQKKKPFQRVLPFMGQKSTSFSDSDTEKTSPVPRGTMTGLRTFISHLGMTTTETDTELQTALNSTDNDQHACSLTNHASHDRTSDDNKNLKQAHESV